MPNLDLVERVVDAISAARYPDGTTLELALAALKAHEEWLAEQGFLIPDETVSEHTAWHVLRSLDVAPEKKYARAVEQALRDGAQAVLKKKAMITAALAEE